MFYRTYKINVCNFNWTLHCREIEKVKKKKRKSGGGDKGGSEKEIEEINLNFVSHAGNGWQFSV